MIVDGEGLVLGRLARQFLKTIIRGTGDSIKCGKDYYIR